MTSKRFLTLEEVVAQILESDCDEENLTVTILPPGTERCTIHKFIDAAYGSAYHIWSFLLPSTVSDEVSYIEDEEKNGWC